MVCERDSVCEVAVCKGDDGRHAGALNRMSECECHVVVCKRRNTQVCVWVEWVEWRRGWNGDDDGDEGTKAE